MSNRYEVWFTTKHGGSDFQAFDSLESANAIAAALKVRPNKMGTHGADATFVELVRIITEVLEKAP